MSDLWVPERVAYDDRDYQAFGTKFLHAIERAFLTDDPGLGKTIQAIRAAVTPCLVVAPRYLCGQWEESIRRHDETAKIAYADGTRKQRDAILDQKADWYIVNYEMMRSYGMPTDIKTYINDESHRLRNRRADHAKATKFMENRDPKSRVYHLSATPFWKSIDDIWMQAHILYPKIFTSYHDFIKLYCNSLMNPHGKMVVSVKPRMKKDLKDLFRPIMLGRTYQEVGRYLPEIVSSTIKLDMPRELRAVYQKLTTTYSMTWMDGEEKRKLIFQPTGVLHALRQVTMQCDKIGAVKGILEDNARNGKETPSVIGFWYKDHAKMMFDTLGKDKAVLVTGDIDAVERHKLAMYAQQTGKHLVATERSLSEGVNLYKYRQFIFAEEDYVPGMNHQFLSRVVRDRNDGGLDREPVQVFYVQVSRSIDVHVHNVAKSRRSTIEATRLLLELTLDRKAA